MKIEINKLSNGEYAFTMNSDDAMEIEIAKEFIWKMIEHFNNTRKR